MKILHVLSSLDPRHGGVTESVKQLARVSIAQGCQVEAATLDADGAVFLKELGFRAHGLGPGRTHFAYSHRLRPWLTANLKSFDIVVAHGLWQYHTVAVRRSALDTSTPYVVYTHGMLDPYFRRNFPLKHLKKWMFWPWGDFRVLRDARAVYFTAEGERRLARESFWLYSAHEVVATLGAEAPGGDGEKQKSVFRERYPELKGRRLALFLGRIHPKKGCDLAIRAFAETLGKELDWQLVMAGPDQVGWSSALRDLASRLGVGSRVTWTGMIEGDVKWGALQAAEFLFLPSHQENFGVVVAEALACGVPALISDKINIWPEVKDSGAGLVEADTAEGAANLLRRWQALGDAGQKRLRENARPCFAERFEIQRTTADWLKSLRTFARTRAEDPVLASA